MTGKLKAVADAVAAWPEVGATTHWRFDQPNRVDGIDFYVGSDELGHIHLNGSIYLATLPASAPCWYLRAWGALSSGVMAGRSPSQTGPALTVLWRCFGATTIGFGHQTVRSPGRNPGDRIWAHEVSIQRAVSADR